MTTFALIQPARRYNPVSGEVGPLHVRNPVDGSYLAKDHPTRVIFTPHWARLLADGDIEIVDVDGPKKPPRKEK